MKEIKYKKKLPTRLMCRNEEEESQVMVFTAIINMRETYKPVR